MAGRQSHCWRVAVSPSKFRTVCSLRRDVEPWSGRLDMDKIQEHFAIVVKTHDGRAECRVDTRAKEPACARCAVHRGPSKTVPLKRIWAAISRHL